MLCSLVGGGRKLWVPQQREDQETDTWGSLGGRARPRVLRHRRLLPGPLLQALLRPKQPKSEGPSPKLGKKETSIFRGAAAPAGQGSEFKSCTKKTGSFRLCPALSIEVPLNCRSCPP